MSKYKEQAVVVAQERIATDIYSLWIQTANIAAEAGPGQFLSVYTRDESKLLPRPISICEVDKDKSYIRLVYRVTGKGTGTQQFAALKEGDQVAVMGPLGNGFMTNCPRKAFLIGGGIGIPPMLELAKQRLRKTDYSRVPGRIIPDRRTKRIWQRLCGYGRRKFWNQGECTGCHP